MLKIAAQSWSWRGSGLRRPPSDLRGGRGSRRRRFQDTPGSRTGNSTRGVRSHCMFDALQLLSHLDGDALNVALLVPESRRVAPGFLIKSLSEHYNAPGRLAEYKRQFQRAFQRPGDDPSILATELETLARRAFMDIEICN